MLADISARFGTGFATLAAIFLLLSSPVSSAIFDDGNDRQILYELRQRTYVSLTDEQRAILRAADRYGNVGFCSRAAGNATLISYNDRPAIVTSAHILIDLKTQQSNCSDEELQNQAIFMPNVSYHNKDHNDFEEAFTLRRVEVEFPGVNMNMNMNRIFVHGNIRATDDFVIFFLKEDVRNDVMPGGHVRGAMPMAGPHSPTNARNGLYMIGMAPDIGDGRAAVYQTCDYAREAHPRGARLVHTCDTVPGSSGSLLAIMDDGELKLKGIHAGDTFKGAVVPPTEHRFEWNYATELAGNYKFCDYQHQWCLDRE